jgi:hypothetical protein
MNSCIAILAIGESCQLMWRDIFLPHLKAYASRHDFTIEVFTEDLDPSGTRHKSWQKLLLAGQERLQKYDRIVYFDTDVLLNPAAPNILDGVPSGKIAAVTWSGSYCNDPAVYDCFRATWTHNNCKLIRDAKIKSFADLAEFGGYPRHDDWLNAGVLVFEPQHAEFLKNIYDTEAEGPNTSLEQQALTHWLCNRRSNLLHSLDRRWNSIFYHERAIHYPFIEVLCPHSFIVAKVVEAALGKNFALHFAADGERQEARTFIAQQHLLTEAAA